MINGPGRHVTAVSDRAALPLGPRRARPALPRLTAARAAVMRALATAGEPVTVAALADQLGQHPNTVREHLDALVGAGRVLRTRSNPSGRGRPAWLYRPAGDPTAAGGDPAADPAGRDGRAAGGDAYWDESFVADGPEYVALAAALIDQVADASPDPQALARHAGERWGRALANRDAAADPADPADAVDAVDAVIGMLRDLRFEPQPGADAATTRLTTCPFLDAARRNPDVVCQIHLGIVRGALQGLGADPDRADLDAFAEPGACLLHLPDRR